jgi:biotin transport system substrate-specific component
MRPSSLDCLVGQSMQIAIREPTLAFVLIRRRTGATQAFLIVAGVTLLALSAQLRIPLPFTPVPVTGQTFAVLLIGALLGSRAGFTTISCYWLVGACGLPVFNGGSGGWTVVSGPTGGYIFGFAAAALLVGWFSERGWDRGKSVIVPLLLGDALIYAFGLPWLGIFVGPRAVAQSGLLPFVPGDLAKIAAAAFTLPAAWSVSERLRLR